MFPVALVRLMYLVQFKMTFYVKPPGGKIALKKLHQDAENRLQFLCQIHQVLDEEHMKKIFITNPNLALNSECLIDGSQRDRTSHFILRYASMKSKSFQIFLTDAETCLFQYRLIKGGQAAIKHSLKTLRRHTCYALKYQVLSFHHRELLENIQEAVDQILTSSMLECQNDHSCHQFVRVPWTMVASLVKDRLVIVQGGKVDIPCKFLIQFLCSVFSALLTHGIEELSSQSIDYEMALCDQRISQISQSLRNLFMSKYGGNCKLKIPIHITHRDIENESKFFPLCMQQLHQMLIKTNRLRHHARLRYTLFLKDIGLPVDENITMWEHYYSKPYKGSGTSCNHSWLGGGGNRYKYSVRHVYGLEGGRINYSSHSCHALQAMKPQPIEMSGCPFSGSDPKETYSFLRTTYGDQLFLKKLMQAVEANKPSTACKLLMKYSLQFMKISHAQLDQRRVSSCGIDSSCCSNKNQMLFVENKVTSNINVKNNDACKISCKNVMCNCEGNVQLKGKCTEPCNRTAHLRSGVHEICGGHKQSDAVDQCSSYLKRNDCDREIVKENYGASLISKSELGSSCMQFPCEKCVKSSVMKTTNFGKHSCPSVSDIEDLSGLADCNFSKPSQYYFQVKDNIKCLKSPVNPH
ncbi:LOW QUALITY PROTEIN: uncharacterized protein LOC135217266 [Macrobrachium nipponense]|uniref:LOW QUALITY PROTEIN: uncharacterized protein LOC135217266 n=1 Tax=Macrobrachium nipponense TaxID=159736 RepID=UPI0030C88E7D